MKKAKIFSLLSAIALLLPTFALANEQGKTKMQLTEQVDIGSTRLKPGNYVVEWNGNGPSLSVQILKDDKTVATAPGKMIELNKPAPYNAVILKPTANGQAKTIDEIDIAHRNQAVQIESNIVSSARPEH
jgi:hypothetical protein